MRMEQFLYKKRNCLTISKNESHPTGTPKCDQPKKQLDNIGNNMIMVSIIYVAGLN